MPVPLDPKVPVVPLGPHIDLLEDDSQALSLADVRDGPAAERFRPMAAERLRLDSGSTGYWLRFALSGTNSDTSDWLIDVGQATLDFVDAYFVQSDGTVSHQVSGDMQPFTARPVPHRLPLFRLPAGAAGPLDVYLRVVKKAPGAVQPRLWRAEAFFAADGARRTIHGIYFGVLIAVGLYAAFVYLSLRDPTYCWYALYVLSIGLFIAALHGYGGQFLWPDAAGAANLPQRLLANAALMMPTPFVRAYLRTWEILPRLDRLMRLHIWVGMALFAVIPLLPHGAGSLTPVAHGILMQMTVITVILSAFRRRPRQAAFMAAATVLWLPGIVLLGLRTFGFIADTPAAEAGPEFFTGLETILFAFALADRVRHIDAARRTAERTAADARGRLARQLIESIDRERRRIAGVLHDSVGQKLTLIRMHLSPPTAAMAAAGSTTGAAKRTGDGLVDLADEAMAELRDVARSLHPYQIEALGLSRAIEAMARDALHQASIEAEIEVEPLGEGLPVEARTHLYRIAQEVVTNVVKHAGASRCRVALRREGDRLRLEVGDDGKGFESGRTAEGHLGLIGIDERVRLLNGELAVDTRPGTGTRIAVSLPVDGTGA